MTLLVTGQSLNRNVSKSIDTLYNLLVTFESGSRVYQMRFHQGFFTNSPTDSELFQDPISLVTGHVMKFVIYKFFTHTHTHTKFEFESLV